MSNSDVMAHLLLIRALITSLLLMSSTAFAEVEICLRKRVKSRVPLRGACCVPDSANGTSE